MNRTATNFSCSLPKYNNDDRIAITIPLFSSDVPVMQSTLSFTLKITQQIHIFRVAAILSGWDDKHMRCFIDIA